MDFLDVPLEALRIFELSLTLLAFKKFLLLIDLWSSNKRSIRCDSLNAHRLLNSWLDNLKHRDLLLELKFRELSLALSAHSILFGCCSEH